MLSHINVTSLGSYLRSMDNIGRQEQSSPKRLGDKRLYISSRIEERGGPGYLGDDLAILISMF